MVIRDRAGMSLLLLALALLEAGCIRFAPSVSKLGAGDSQAGPPPNDSLSHNYISESRGGQIAVTGTQRKLTGAFAMNRAHISESTIESGGQRVPGRFRLESGSVTIMAPVVASAKGGP